jgi:hypothetical protein
MKRGFNPLIFLQSPYFLSSSLLKTFSINPFHGQYPKIAVTINATPINPIIQLSIPWMKKVNSIKMAPMTIRKIASFVATFLVLAIGSMLLSFPHP